MYSIYQTDSHGKSMREAAEEFARTYWDKPRVVRFEKRDGCFFRVADGTRTYQVVSEVAVTLKKPAIYKIVITA